jgi:hypothetical protein
MKRPSVQEVIGIVQLGGGEFLGVQCARSESLVLFNDPRSHSTLAVPISELTPEAVRVKIKNSDQ